MSCANSCPMSKLPATSNAHGDLYSEVYWTMICAGPGLDMVAETFLASFAVGSGSIAMSGFVIRAMVGKDLSREHGLLLKRA